MDTQLPDREEVRNREALRYREELRNREDSTTYYGKYSLLKSMSWSAVLAGAVIGVGISYILNLFAMSLGLTVFGTTTTSPNTIMIGGFIGLLLIAILSMGTAGWIAGYLGRPRSLHRDFGALYGFTAWCAALVLTVLLSANFGKIISYNLAPLQNPSYVLTSVDGNNIMSAPNSSVTNATAINTLTPTTTNQNVVNAQDAAKNLALTTFLAFVLAFISGIASCIGGHLGFRSSEKATVKNRP